MDIVQLLYIIIGSFLGFGFALVAEFALTQMKKHKDALKAKSNLNDELIHIYHDFYDVENNQLRTEEIFFDTPIWNSVTSTGDILIMLNKNKSFNSYYSKVMDIYGKLKAIEKMQSIGNKDYKEDIFSAKAHIVSLIRDKDILNIS
ncbi:MAG: hypothetical protein LBC73_09035 [Oscillospiraceae bacterium]|jgi:SUMO ligase MMS21 Smc5/6 complex component|nr:hypothetical protein [Oscillospiraceae bacterium]